MTVFGTQGTQGLCDINVIRFSDMVGGGGEGGTGASPLFSFFFTFIFKVFFSSPFKKKTFLFLFFVWLVSSEPSHVH